MAGFTNNGCGPLHVPGYDSIPLDFELPPEAGFAHGLIAYRHSPRLTKREMTMLQLMQHITEQPGWDRAALDTDETKLAEWYRNATEETEGYLISTAAWSWCLAELRDKAETMQRTGRLLVLDSSSAVCQANVSMEVSLEEIQKEVARLGAQPSQDCPLVDPFMFPLVYGRSHVLVHGGKVSMEDLWGQTGEVTEEVPAHPVDLLGREPGSDLARRPGSGGPESCWSNGFQWLPCEVQFSPSRTPDNTLGVQITSYVNNLHPDSHQGLYRHLERLIAASVPSWNDILFYGNTRGRHPPRILTYSCQVHNHMERNKIILEVAPFLDWRGLCDTHEDWQKLREAAREYITGPEPPKLKQADPFPRLADNLLDELTPEQWDVPKDVSRLLQIKRDSKGNLQGGR